MFARLEQAADELGVNDRAIHRRTRLDRQDGLAHRPRTLDQLTADDFDDYRGWPHSGSRHPIPTGTVPGLGPAARRSGCCPPTAALRQHVRRGQQTTTELVDRYAIRSAKIRQMLIRYLDERRPALDYSTLRSLACSLAGTFWVEIETPPPRPGHPAPARRRRRGMETSAWPPSPARTGRSGNGATAST